MLNDQFGQWLRHDALSPPVALQTDRRRAQIIGEWPPFNIELYYH